MKTLLMSFLFVLLACETESQLELTESINVEVEEKSADPCAIVIGEIFQVNTPEVDLMVRYYPDFNPLTSPDNYWLVSEYKGHYFNALIDQNEVRGILYYGAFISRNQSKNADYLLEVDKMYDYAESIGIYLSDLSVSNIFISDGDNQLKTVIYASYTCGGISYYLYGCQRDVNSRSVILGCFASGYKGY